jgi:hypothetical protein
LVSRAESVGGTLPHPGGEMRLARLRRVDGRLFLAPAVTRRPVGAVPAHVDRQRVVLDLALLVGIEVSGRAVHAYPVGGDVARGVLTVVRFATLLCVPNHVEVHVILWADAKIRALLELAGFGGYPNSDAHLHYEDRGRAPDRRWGPDRCGPLGAQKAPARGEDGGFLVGGPRPGLPKHQGGRCVAGIRSCALCVVCSRRPGCPPRFASTT